MASTALTFEEGTFAGKQVRVTDDGKFVSIYDVISVAGVGRAAHNVWAEIDKEVLQMSVQNGRTSLDHGKVIFKDHKFPGQGKATFIFTKFTYVLKYCSSGQRNTPVINAAGLVRLLFLLPGAKARQFVNQSADVLVRYLGGGKSGFHLFIINPSHKPEPNSVILFLADDTLIAEIHKNKEEALINPNSAQGFMRISSGISNVDTLAYKAKLAEIEAMQAKTKALEAETRINQRKDYEALQLFIQNNVQDPRRVSNFNDNIINGLAHTYGFSRLQIADAEKDDSDRVYTIDELIMEEFKTNSGTLKKAEIGKIIKKAWKQQFGDLHNPKVKKYVNGEIREVNAYPTSFKDTMMEIIRNELADDDE